MIHTMPKRLWYVEQYLIPSMLKQGIDQNDIMVYNDSDGEGNLRACINAFLQVPDDEDGTWHLQDDIVISSRFAKVTDRNNSGIVCGFKSRYDGQTPAGMIRINQMWFSFLCIRIPNKIARGCANWISKYIIGNPVYKEWWEQGVNDDMLFRKYIEQYHKDLTALNLNPNIVDHIDYLIGGTVNSNTREITKIRSKLWEEENIVKELEKALKKEAD